MTDDLKRKTAAAFGWSALQSWSVKFMSLLLFFVLTRFLTPSQMGLAQTVIVLLAFVAILSEQGFHSAIVQRPGLRAEDVNLPFFIATCVALTAACAMFFFSGVIAALLKESEAQNLIRVAALIPPITAANGFAIAMLRRTLDFKTIAKASFVASAVSGFVSLILVTQGWGSMALVLQAAISGAMTALTVWPSSCWRPTGHFETTHFRGLLNFSSANFASQLIDFLSGRLIDLIILGRYGLAALGMYAVGAKLYLTVLELLASALMVVAMSAMAKLIGEPIRLRRTYLRFIYLASTTTLPLFVGIAALAPEVCNILFGNKWTSAPAITHWLSLLGAIQVIQLFNGAVLDATGRPRWVLAINIAKLALGAGVLLIYPATSIEQLTIAFVAAQLCVAPLSFTLAVKTTGALWQGVAAQVLPSIGSASVAYGAVYLVRQTEFVQSMATWSTGLLLGTLFFSTFVITQLTHSRCKLVSEFQFVINGYKKNK